MEDDKKLIGRTVDIVAAYVTKNPLPGADLSGLILSVHASLSGTSTPAAPVTETKAPSVSIKKSITPNYLICLEDGSQFKSLKRHLQTKYGLSPDAYRAKWGLPKDYPMVAPAYSAARSALAKSMQLGMRGNVGRGKAKAPAKSAR